jgi:hypothetical protein
MRKLVTMMVLSFFVASEFAFGFPFCRPSCSNQDSGQDSVELAQARPRSSKAGEKPSPKAREVTSPHPSRRKKTSKSKPKPKSDSRKNDRLRQEATAYLKQHNRKTLGISSKVVLPEGIAFFSLNTAIATLSVCAATLVYLVKMLVLFNEGFVDCAHLKEPVRSLLKYHLALGLLASESNEYALNAATLVS